MGFTGKLFEVDDATLATAQDGFDDALDFFAKSCVLVYAGGAPAPSQNPWAGGGDSPSAHTDTVNLSISWEERDYWVRLPSGTKAPEGAIQTKGYMTDVDKVIRASYLLVEDPLGRGLRQKFERAGDPVDPSNIIQNRYFVCNWRRVA